MNLTSEFHLLAVQVSSFLQQYFSPNCPSFLLNLVFLFLQQYPVAVLLDLNMYIFTKFYQSYNTAKKSNHFSKK